MAKKALYGRSLKQTRRYRKMYRDLTLRERLLIFHRVTMRERYSPLERAKLFAVIYIGAVNFVWGRICG
jgi:hypothetical protein